MKKKWPKVSIITPTLNSSRTIGLFFKSISNQIYFGKLEVIILDGGSVDNTLDIAKINRARVYNNRLKTGEAGKALGVKKANGEILIFIDSDNVLPNKNWITEMVKPLVDDISVLASEPIKFEYRKNDFWLTRYFSLLGMGDPINLFIGNYDRYSYVTNRWTGLNLNVEKKANFIKVELKNKFPTIGANGFLIRKKAFDKYLINDYLFDIDVLKTIAKKNPIFVAKVNIGIVHLFSGDIGTFIRKQRRRIRDYLYFISVGQRGVYGEKLMVYIGVTKFIVSCILCIPLLLQSIVGYIRKPDSVWMFHPIACYITLFSYIYETFRSFLIREEYNRENWSQ